MARFAELAAFLAPIAAFLIWRAALARGLAGPDPRQLAMLTIALLVLCAGLVYLAERDKLPPGRYVPAQTVDGRIVPGHTAGRGE